MRVHISFKFFFPRIDWFCIRKTTFRYQFIFFLGIKTDIIESRKLVWKNWEIRREEETGEKTFLIKSNKREMKANESEQDFLYSF